MSYKFNPFTGTLDEVGAGGGAATPGGADTQVQFNDGGSFAGDSGLTYDDTAGALTVGGKTVTTDSPVINLSQTWNNAATTFTGLKLNVTDAASAASSKLLDLQVNGTSKITASNEGAIPTLELVSGGTIFVDRDSTNGIIIGNYADRSIRLGSTTSLNFCTVSPTTGSDLQIKREQANVLVVTDGSTGTGYLKLIPTTVGALTAAATVGAGTKAFVTDSTSTLSSHHGQAVVGGGSNFVPVFSDGTNWIVG
jgi:hypothetical protein